MARCISTLWFLLVLCGTYLTPNAFAAEDTKPPEEDYYELYRLLVDTMDQVERNYVKHIDRRELIEAAIEGVLDELDPYSAYIDPSEVQRFRTTVESEFSGIGIQLASDSRQLTIFSPLVGSPAYNAGLLAGDRIVEIEGENTEGMRIDEAVRLLKGEPGTKVTLAVIHPGKTEKIEVTLIRQQIRVDTLLGDQRKDDDTWDYMLRPEQGIGYIRLTAFSRDTARQLRGVLQGLQSDGLKALVLDLRFNPGGLLTEAIEVSDLFISSGRIVSTEGRNSPERTWDATRRGTFEGFPMAVLVNRYSASASEIVAACLQDNKRAVIMGDRTWGKGSVQSVIELEGGDSLLKLTTAAYLRPNGKSLHRFPNDEDQEEWGVAPDEGFQLRLSNAEMERLLRYRRDRDVVRSNGHPEEDAEESAEHPNPPEDESAEEETEALDVEDPDADVSEGDPGREEDRTALADDETTRSPVQPLFVDRQLQLAENYLIQQLAPEPDNVVEPGDDNKEEALSTETAEPENGTSGEAVSNDAAGSSA